MRDRAMNLLLFVILVPIITVSLLPNVYASGARLDYDDNIDYDNI
jgi:hypothetical protein